MTLETRTILVVEDNPISLKLMRLALETAGYDVRVAADARGALAAMAEAVPDLVLQDLGLPDMDGMDLVRRLRSLPGGQLVPILAVTGMLSRVNEGQAIAAGFTGCLAKPVAPSRLVQEVAGLLGAGRPPAGPRARGRRLLLVDDDAIQLKMYRLRLEGEGHEVEVAVDGVTALELARSRPPDLVVSDVLMPRMDGFQLCRAVRADPALAHVPVILQTSHFLEDADHRLGRTCGAAAFLSRGNGFAELTRTIDAVIGLAPVPEPGSVAAIATPEEEYTSRIVRQLERQIESNARLSERCASQTAALSGLSAFASALSSSADVTDSLGVLLAQSLDVAGLSRGVLYKVDASGALVLKAWVGIGHQLGARGPDGLADCGELLLRVTRSSTPVVAGTGTSSELAVVLERLSARSALLMPLSFGDSPVGLIIMVADDRLLSAEDWMAFARIVGAHLGQTVALARSYTRLKESEERFRQLAASLPQVFWMTRADLSEVLYVSPAYEQIWDRTCESLYAAPTSWSDAIVPEDRAAALAAATSDQDRTVEYRILRPDGTRRLIRDRMHVTRDACGAVLRRTGMAEDITAMRELEERYRQSQKMEAFGQLAGGIAHDFNNLLTVQQGYCELALADLREDDPLRRDLEPIMRSAKRATALTRQLLAFSRKQVLQPQLLDLNASVREIQKMLGRLIGEDIQIVVRLASDLLPVMADAGQVEQVLLNLAVNARDAMPRGGRLSIETSAVHREGDWIAIQVTDTGCGMTQDVKARIFEPFFTTKEPGRGTGLGLATVVGIVQQSGGSITVESQPGTGTSFSIHLPVATGLQIQNSLEVANGTKNIARTPKAYGTVLIVEDEADVALLAASMLRRRSYTVLVAHGVEEALVIAKAHSGRIDLVLSDVVMPGASGPEVVTRLRALVGDVHALFMTGYMDDAMLRHGVHEGEVALLHKPFTAESLEAAVRRTLER